MRKLMAALMALVLALGLGCAALAESADTLAAQQAAWLPDSLTNSGWTEKDGNRITLDVEPCLEGDSPFKAAVTASDSASECVEWVYYCSFDPVIHKLLASRVTCSKEVWPDGADEPEITLIYDRESKAEFELDEEGFLVLRDSEAKDDNEYEISLIGFEKVTGSNEKGQDLTEEIQAACKEITGRLMGVSYTPLKLLAQEGTSVCVLCEATVVYPDAQPNLALLYFDTAKGSEATPFIVLLTDDGSEG